ncbi:hypothetical protein AAC387_Pa12g1981 [Persea americana]
MALILLLLICSGHVAMLEANACVGLSNMQRGVGGRRLVVGRRRCEREMLDRDRIVPGGPDSQHHDVPPTTP